MKPTEEIGMESLYSNASIFQNEDFVAAIMHGGKKICQKCRRGNDEKNTYCYFCWSEFLKQP